MDRFRGDAVVLWDSLATLPVVTDLVDVTDGVLLDEKQHGVAVASRHGLVEIWRDDALDLAATKAELDLDTPSAALDTIVRAQAGGVGGNSVTVAAVADSAAAGGVTIEEVGNAVTIHFEDGVSTVGHVETAIAGSTLIEVKTAGTGATVLTGADAFAATALAGGAAETDSAAAVQGPVTLGGWNGSAWFPVAVVAAADFTVGRQRGLMVVVENAGLFEALALYSDQNTVSDSGTVRATYTPIRETAG